MSIAPLAARALDDQAAKLSQITFHEKLGTVADKVDRVAKLARWLVEAVPSAQVKVFVDTAPVMEKPLAEAAGLG